MSNSNQHSEAEEVIASFHSSEVSAHEFQAFMDELIIHYLTSYHFYESRKVKKKGKKINLIRFNLIQLSKLAATFPKS